jgi:DNA mismatch endonuclease (patch repair protein)
MAERSPEVTSRIMASIKGRDTRPEKLLRSALWARGLRYRIHLSRVPGTPDIAFTREKLAVFCDGEFWHGYGWEARKAKLKSNRSYWVPKIERNMARDREVDRRLAESGWEVLRIWDFEILNDLESCVARTEAALGMCRSGRHGVRGSAPSSAASPSPTYSADSHTS